MKLSKKLKKNFISSVVAQCNPYAKTGVSIEVPVYTKKLTNKGEETVKTYATKPQFINHKRRVKTLIRACNTDTELIHEVGKYIAKYPKSKAA